MGLPYLADFALVVTLRVPYVPRSGAAFKAAQHAQAELNDAPPSLPTLQAEDCVADFMAVSKALDAAGAAAIRRLSDSGSSSGEGAQVLAQLQAAVESWDTAWQHPLACWEQAARPNLPVQEVVEQLRQLLQQGAQLAAALLSYFQLPEQQEAAAVQLAQAAATRSCSYLRCAQLEARKSKRCRACGCARYCCHACSVLDWRHGSHNKRTCAALAALQQEAAEPEQ